MMEIYIIWKIWMQIYMVQVMIIFQNFYCLHIQCLIQLIINSSSFLIDSSSILVELYAALVESSSFFTDSYAALIESSLVCVDSSCLLSSS